jgi:hypothetical protein
MTTYALGIDRQGVKQLKALARFTPPASDKRERLRSFGLDAVGILACDMFTLGIASVNKGIRWHSDAPDTTLAVNAATLLSMIPADGGTITIDGDRFTVSALQYEAQGVMDVEPWMRWQQLIPEPGDMHPVGAFNPALMGKFGPLADALAGKPRQAVRLIAYHPDTAVKPMVVQAEDRSTLGLLMPMRIS